MGLLDTAQNMLGQPLDPKFRERIFAFLQNPSFELWDTIHCIIICPKGPVSTVWQAVVAIDPSYRDIYKPAARGDPASARWKRYPDPLTVARGVKQALDNCSKI